MFVTGRPLATQPPSPPQAAPTADGAKSDVYPGPQQVDLTLVTSRGLAVYLGSGYWARTMVWTSITSSARP